MRRLTYLVDTDWVISYLNGYRSIVERVETLQDEAGLAMSILSLGEVYEGVYYSTDPIRSERGLRDCLAGVTLLGVDEEICQIFGRERGKLRKGRQIIGDFDLILAATCLRYNLTICTNNRREFVRVEGLRILSQP